MICVLETKDKHRIEKAQVVFLDYYSLLISLNEPVVNVYTLLFMFISYFFFLLSRYV